MLLKPPAFAPSFDTHSSRADVAAELLRHFRKLHVNIWCSLMLTNSITISMKAWTMPCLL